MTTIKSRKTRKASPSVEAAIKRVEAITPPVTKQQQASIDRFQQEFYGALARLDARTARGIDPCAVRDPNGNYCRAASAEDAYYISIGRSDLAASY